MKSNWEIGRILMIVGLFLALLVILSTSPGAGFTYEGTPGVKPATTIGPSGIAVLARENSPAGSTNRNLMITTTNCTGQSPFTTPSAGNLKINISAVDPREVLDKVATLPMTTWKYRGEERLIRHMGPIGEDFNAAFRLGGTDANIALVDESGVALAAIQGLNQKVEQQEAELKDRDTRIKTLEKRLDELEKLMAPVAQH